MTALQLLQPILDEELQRNNFFNGRLLSAEDLRAEQNTNHAERALLGRAIGDGVAWGLRVSSLSLDPARVKVTRGVALDRAGDLLRLSEDAEVTLVPAPQSQIPSTDTGLFANCEPLVTQTPIVAGAYVLVLSPAAGFRQQALVSDPNAVALGRGPCGPRFTVEGVRFRLVALTLSNASVVGSSLIGRITAQLPATTDAKIQRLRNLLAHACYGS